MRHLKVNDIVHIGNRYYKIKIRPHDGMDYMLSNIDKPEAEN